MEEEKQVLHELPHKRQVKFRFLFVVAICTRQPFLCFPVLSGVQGLRMFYRGNGKIIIKNYAMREIRLLKIT